MPESGKPIKNQIDMRGPIREDIDTRLIKGHACLQEVCKPNNYKRSEAPSTTVLANIVNSGSNAIEDIDDKANDPGGKKKRRKKSKKGTKQRDEAEGFTVLGDPTDSQKKKVARVLPHWLAHPDIMQVLTLSVPNLPIAWFCRWTYKQSN